MGQLKNQGLRDQTLLGINAAPLGGFRSFLMAGGTLFHPARVQACMASSSPLGSQHQRHRFGQRCVTTAVPNTPISWQRRRLPPAGFPERPDVLGEQTEVAAAGGRRSMVEQGVASCPHASPCQHSPRRGAAAPRPMGTVQGSPAACGGGTLCHDAHT